MIIIMMMIIIIIMITIAIIIITSRELGVALAHMTSLVTQKFHLTFIQYIHGHTCGQQYHSDDHNDEDVGINIMVMIEMMMRIGF